MVFSTFSNIIAGELRSSDKFHQAVNPSTNKPLPAVPLATAQDLEDAVLAARKAFPGWSGTAWENRGELIAKAVTVLRQNKDSMVKLLIAEGGKPVPRQAPLELRIVEDSDDIQVTLRYVPIGVVGGILPWNMPLVLGANKIGAALITGNCIILKPSPYTPYSVTKFTELVRSIFPAGVIQSLNGDDSMGPAMCKHPGIGKISFTGSTATGKKIMSSASTTLKRVTLELGGNSASIICPDVDVKLVAPQLALGSFFNAGQLCVASKRIFVHKDIYKEFMHEFTEHVKGWKTGPMSSTNADASVTMGPVQNAMQYDIVNKIFRDSQERGHKFALGGHIGEGQGLVIPPTIVDNPPDNSMVVEMEAFGPIVPVLSWSEEDEVISRVNNTDTGLGGAVWSNDLARATRLAARIEAGTVWINGWERPLHEAYFSGHKQSGIGGEGGREGLLPYCNAQCFHHYKAFIGVKSEI
ncbi:hypothetical protein ACLOAV_000554 [Pseudogymnoascus australis]